MSWAKGSSGRPRAGSWLAQREDGRSQCPQCFHSLTLGSFLITTRPFEISFSICLIAAHFDVPDQNFRKCDWQQPSLASGLHCLSAKSRCSVHVTEAQTHTKNGNSYLSSADCHSSALWVSSSKWIIPACFSGVSWSFLSVLCSESLVYKYFTFNQQVWIPSKKLL